MPIPDQCLDMHTKRDFTLEERNSKVKFENPKRHTIEQIRIDGCVIIDGERCDYLVNVKACDLSVLVELKGGNVAKAVSQLKTTSQRLASELYGTKKWVISSTRCPLTGADITKLKREIREKHGAELTVKNRVAEMTI